jgi:hypothetical protein
MLGMTMMIGWPKALKASWAAQDTAQDQRQAHQQGDQIRPQALAGQGAQGGDSNDERQGGVKVHGKQGLYRPARGAVKLR